jgi:hypothetical protein
VDASDLAFFTSNELIDELLRRTTFQGVVVHSEEEHRGGEWTGQRMFKVRYSQDFNAETARRLLEVVASHLDRNEC